MVDAAVYIDYFGYFYLAVLDNWLIVNRIDCHQNPLSGCSEEGSVGVDVSESSNRGNYHGSHHVFLQSHPRNADTQMRSHKNANFINDGYDKRGQIVQSCHPLLMGMVSSLRPDISAMMFDEFSDLFNRLIGHIFYQHLAYVLSPVDIHQTGHITGLVRHKFAKNEFAVEIRIFLQYFSTGLDNKMSDGRSILLGTLFNKIEDFIHSERDVIVDDAVTGRTPVGQCEFSSRAQGFGSWVEDGDEDVEGNEGEEPVDQVDFVEKGEEYSRAVEGKLKNVHFSLLMIAIRDISYILEISNYRSSGYDQQQPLRGCMFSPTGFYRFRANDVACCCSSGLFPFVSLPSFTSLRSSFSSMAGKLPLFSR